MDAAGEPAGTEGEAGRPGRPRLFYGWWIVVAGFGIQALIGALFMQAYGSYAAIFARDFGWSRTTLAVAFSMARAESGVLGPAQGWAIDRFGPQAVMHVGLVMLGLGFMLFSRIDSLPMFYAAFFVMAVGQSLGGFLALSVAVVNWFEQRRATALGVMQTGWAAGGLAVPLVAASMVTFGWRETAFASGVLILLLALPLARLVRHRPQELGLERDGVSHEQARRRDAEALAAAGQGDASAGRADFTWLPTAWCGCPGAAREYSPSSIPRLRSGLSTICRTRKTSSLTPSTSIPKPATSGSAGQPTTRCSASSPAPRS